uniref:Uncharacterized protein n=1 Tax=Wuchereria bancrofti TaxID=6293 RepID=A0A1I8E8L6_WUCBA
IGVEWKFVALFDLLCYVQLTHSEKHRGTNRGNGSFGSTKIAMARPATRRNRFFWELIVAFMFVVSAAVFQTFHFFNNAWLVHTNGSYIYQRGLGDDCVKSGEFSDGIKCTSWLDGEYSTFVINGQDITASDVVPPSTVYLSKHFLVLMPSLLTFRTEIGTRSHDFQRFIILVHYFLFIFHLCETQSQSAEALMWCDCIARRFRWFLLRIFVNVFIIFIVMADSSEPFIKTMKYCSLGSAFYYFLLSCLLFWIGSAVHFDSWIDVYDNIHTNDLPMGLLGHIRRNDNGRYVV